MKERGLQRIVGTVAVLLVVSLAAAIGSLDYQVMTVEMKR